MTHARRQCTRTPQEQEASETSHQRPPPPSHTINTTSAEHRRLFHIHSTPTTLTILSTLHHHPFYRNNEAVLIRPRPGGLRLRLHYYLPRQLMSTGHISLRWCTRWRHHPHGQDRNRHHSKGIVRLLRNDHHRPSIGY